jgi:hypothetical protein
MPDIVPSKTTRLERSKYWRDINHETWELSRELFQVHHQVGVWIIGAMFIGFMRGWHVVAQDFTTTLLFTVLPTVGYLTLVLSANFLRAIVRVPIRYRREAMQRVEEIAQMKAPQLQLEFPEIELNFSSTKTIVFVRVRNLTALTIENVFVRIASIEKIEGPEEPSKLLHTLQDYVGLPLSIHGARTSPSTGHILHEATIHAEDTALFDVLLMQSTHVTLFHANSAPSPAWTSIKEPERIWWIRSPEAKLPLGYYRMQLKAQGRNTPPVMLTIEFMQSSSKRTVKQIEEPVPRETLSTIA